MNVMYYLSAVMKTVGLFSFFIAAPISGITSFILLHLQKNEKVSRIGSWHLFLIIPYLIFVTLLTMILENHINIVFVYIIEFFLWIIEPLPGLIVVNQGKKDNSSIFEIRSTYSLYEILASSHKWCDNPDGILLISSTYNFLVLTYTQKYLDRLYPWSCQRLVDWSFVFYGIKYSWEVAKWIY